MNRKSKFIKLLSLLLFVSLLFGCGDSETGSNTNKKEQTSSEKDIDNSVVCSDIINNFKNDYNVTNVSLNNEKILDNIDESKIKCAVKSEKEIFDKTVKISYDIDNFVYEKEYKVKYIEKDNNFELDNIKDMDGILSLSKCDNLKTSTGLNASEIVNKKYKNNFDTLEFDGSKVDGGKCIYTYKANRNGSLYNADFIINVDLLLENVIVNQKQQKLSYRIKSDIHGIEEKNVTFKLNGVYSGKIPYEHDNNTLSFEIKDVSGKKVTLAKGANRIKSGYEYSPIQLKTEAKINLNSSSGYYELILEDEEIDGNGDLNQITFNILKDELGVSCFVNDSNDCQFKLIKK